MQPAAMLANRILITQQLQLANIASVVSRTIGSVSSIIFDTLPLLLFQE